jgi:hypothetical protein
MADMGEDIELKRTSNEAMEVECFSELTSRSHLSHRNGRRCHGEGYDI